MSAAAVSPSAAAATTERHWGVTLRSFAYVAIAAAAAILAPHPALYALAEVALGLAILRVFCLMHDLSHKNMTNIRRWDDFFGYAASVICAIPYHPWKRVHMAHHKWAGWRQPDPTEDDESFADMPGAAQFVANIAWKTGVPLLGLAFSFKTFWNHPRLVKRFDNRKDHRRFLFSYALVAGVHAALFAALGTAYLWAFLPAFFIFLCIMDPLAISQHAGIEIHDVPEGSKVRSFKLAEQNQFARTITCPYWFERHILLGFNLHSYHHAKPRVPGHLVCDLDDVTPVHSENWLAWLVRVKKLHLRDVVH